MNTYKKILNILVGGAAILCSATSIQAQSASDLWSAQWEVKLESAFGAFETRADDAQNVYAIGVDESGYQLGSLIVKYDKNGSELWRRNYMQPGNTQTSANAIDFDKKGNVIITGIASPSGKVVTQSYAADGSLRWINSYESDGYPIVNPRDIATDKSGNSFITGSISPSGVNNARDVFVIKIDKNGVLLWQQFYNGTSSLGDFGVIVDTDKKGNVLVGGYTTSSNFDRDMLVLKYDKNGALLWVNTFNGPDGLSDQVSDMEVLKSGDVVVVGNSFSGRAVVQYDAGGALDWSQFSPGPYNSAHSLVTDKSKSVIVTSTISTFDGIETVKYNKKGVLLYSDTYTFANSDIVVRNLAVSCAGNFYFGAWDDFGANDVITVRYGSSKKNKHVGKCHNKKEKKRGQG